MSDAVRIPISACLHVSDVIKQLKADGVDVGDLFVEVRPGEVELRDKIGSYGVRRFDPVGWGVRP